jgi:glycosyltransferase involved in cell wall biosynthesis
MRIAWTGPVGTGGGVPGMGTLILEEMLEQGVEVDLYLPLVGAEPPPIKGSPRLRIVEHRSRWRWRRWYSRTKPSALFTSLAARSLANIRLSLRLLAEHRRRPYAAVFQLSTTELFLLGRLRSIAPPIVVHPCSHAAGELRWHRAEEKYALRSERRSVHLLMRALLWLRSRIQPGELARADLIIGPSNRFLDLVCEDYGVPRAKVGVLRHPIDTDRFSPGPPNGGLGPDGRRTLLFISRISARKGVPEIIELSHRLQDLAGSVRILVVGGVTMWSDYSAHLEDLNGAVAEYVGGVPYPELPALMRSSSMLLVPSRYEPGSIVTGEALACGLPVVLSDEVGPVEIARGPHVRVHRAGDIDDLERAVRSMLDAIDADEASLRATARANAIAHLAPSLVVAALLDQIAALGSDGERSAVTDNARGSGIPTPASGVEALPDPVTADGLAPAIGG